MIMFQKNFVDIQISSKAWDIKLALNIISVFCIVGLHIDQLRENRWSTYQWRVHF